MSDPRPTVRDVRTLVTGGTGFLGKQLLPLLVSRHGGDDVAVLVRASSVGKLDDLRARLGAPGLRAVVGDVGAPACGVVEQDMAWLAGAQVFHLAAVYDMAAGETETALANVDGTQHVLDLCAALGSPRLQHVSSIAVAGRWQGPFDETMFDEGQPLDHPYYRTKFDAEALVRADGRTPFRVYRPGIVIGSSLTGEADRTDGPYYAFPLIQKVRDALPSWVPLVVPEGGDMPLVPVDFVAAALDHIGALEGRDGETFHLTDPDPLSLGDTMAAFCKAAHAPEVAIRIDSRVAAMVPKGATTAIGALPAVQQVWTQVLESLGVPPAAMAYATTSATFPCPVAQAALAGSGIAVAPLRSYAWRVWDYWERHLDPHLVTEANLRRQLAGKVVLITGASSGIGRAIASALAGAGATIVGVARSEGPLAELKAEVEALGGTAAVYPTDLSDPEACRALVRTVEAEHGSVDLLINNAGRSIRRAVTRSTDRFHDFERTMQLNYFGPVALVLEALPGMQARGAGHIVNISSIGVQTHPPRFAAYVASKAALDAFSTCLAPEVAADGIAVTAVQMPLVRTPMIAPTGLYKSFPTISPEEAAEMVLGALLTRQPEVSTRLGKLGQLTDAVAPGLHRTVMSAVYHVLPHSAERNEDGTKAKAEVGPEAYALGMLMRGIHL